MWIRRWENYLFIKITQWELWERAGKILKMIKKWEIKVMNIICKQWGINLDDWLKGKRRRKNVTFTPSSHPHTFTIIYSHTVSDFVHPHLFASHSLILMFTLFSSFPLHFILIRTPLRSASHPRFILELKLLQLMLKLCFYAQRN